MSARIQNALINLNDKIDALHKVAENARHQNQNKKPAKAAGSPDLFSVVGGAAKAPANASMLDAKLLASRLDNAISKVEQILKEGQA